MLVDRTFERHRLERISAFPRPSDAVSAALQQRSCSTYCGLKRRPQATDKHEENGTRGRRAGGRH